MGCNMHDVFYIEISYIDSDAACQQWVNESVTLRGENLGEVSLYNTLGQKVETFFTDETQLIIPTAKYQNGIYFVKTSNGKTQRLVIAHE